MPDEDKKKKEEAGEGGRGGDRCRIKKKIRRKTCKLFLGIDPATNGNLHRGHGGPRRFYFADFVNNYLSAALRDLDVNSI